MAVSGLCALLPSRVKRTSQAAMLVATLAFPLVATACDPGAGPKAAGAVAPAPTQVIDLVNNARSALGVPSVAMNDSLRERAQAWAEHLASLGRLEHTSDLAAGLTIPWRVLGENVGYGATISNVCDAFLKSPSHRANVVDTRFNAVGVGVVVDERGRTFVVEQFAAL